MTNKISDSNKYHNKKYLKAIKQIITHFIKIDRLCHKFKTIQSHRHPFKIKETSKAQVSFMLRAKRVEIYINMSYQPKYNLLH